MSLGGVASNALDLLAFLRPKQSAKSNAAGGATSGTDSQATGFLSQVGANGTGDVAAGGATGSSTATSPLSSGVLGFLIQNQGQQSADSVGTGTQKLSSSQATLFAKLDTDGDGTISKSEFAAAVGANDNTSAADAASKKLDANDDGSIDPSELAAARPHRHHHHHVQISDASSAQSGDATKATSGTDNGKSDAVAGLSETSATSTIQPTAASNNTLETLTRLQGQLFTSSTVPISGA